MRFLLLLGLTLPLAAAAGDACAACSVTLTQPANNSTQINSPLFRWNANAECTQFRVQFSVAGMFLPADRVQTAWQTGKNYSYSEATWESYQTGSWASGVYWRVVGRDAAGVSVNSSRRRIFMDPDVDDDGVSVGGGDCNDSDPDIRPTAAEICADGVDNDCEGGIDEECDPHLAYGDLIITEIMANPARVPDEDGEWFEIHNPTASSILLEGVTVTNDAGGLFLIDVPLSVGPGQDVALVRNGDVNVNGFVVAAYAYDVGFDLTAADETLSLWDAYGDLIDEVHVHAAFPQPQGASLALDPALTDVNLNDDSASWCPAMSPYGDGDYGSPGHTNPPCVGMVNTVSWGNLQFPQSVSVSVGAPDVGLIFGRLYQPGITDYIGPGPGILAQLGYGLDAADPTGDETWLWVDGVYNVDADGLYYGDHANDEYKATFSPPWVGTWYYIFRYSADGGFSWRYADWDGTDNGYDPGMAGTLTVY